jgi:hypothetical protein
MIAHPLDSQLAIVGLLWLGVMRHARWLRRGVVSPQPPVQPVPPQGKRTRSRANTGHRCYSLKVLGGFALSLGKLCPR